jgi:hypothetical protein
MNFLPSEAVTGATVGGGPRQGTTVLLSSRYIQFSLLEGGWMMALLFLFI